MANALAIDTSTGADTNGVMLLLSVTYTGIDVPGGVINTQLQVYLDPQAQPAAIRSAMASAVAAQAVELGFTVAGGNMTLPAYQKG